MLCWICCRQNCIGLGEEESPHCRRRTSWIQKPLILGGCEMGPSQGMSGTFGLPHPETLVWKGNCIYFGPLKGCLILGGWAGLSIEFNNPSVSFSDVQPWNLNQICILINFAVTGLQVWWPRKGCAKYVQTHLVAALFFFDGAIFSPDSERIRQESACKGPGLWTSPKLISIN